MAEAVTPVRQAIRRGNVMDKVRQLHEGMTLEELRSFGEAMLPFRREEVADVDRRRAKADENGAVFVAQEDRVIIKELCAQVERETARFSHPALTELRDEWALMATQLQGAVEALSRHASPKRVDAKDQRAYTRSQFLVHYGPEKGVDRWEASEAVSKCPLCHKNYLERKIRWHAAHCTGGAAAAPAAPPVAVPFP